MLKRSRDPLESTPAPAAKRRQREPLGSSPLSARSTASSSTLHSVYTPRTPFSIPSDSPSNPFGLKKSLVALELPVPTSFGKHVVLRFQFIQDKLPTEVHNPRPARKPVLVYRVAQVPTTYTFRHMHKLIFYLFASDVGRHHSVRQPTPRAAKGKAKAISRAISLGRLPSTPTGQKRALAKSASLSAMQPESWTGHVFEVYKANKEQPLVGDEEVMKGIVLPTGRLWRKLSSVRERHIFRDLYGSVESGSKQEGEDSDEEDDWAWEAEDDFTLAHLWPSGPSLRRAIIYRHNPRVSIHITVHKGAIPHRKGVGNLPFVFLSQGSAGDTIKIFHDIHNQRKAWHTHADDSDDDLPSLPSSVATTATQINRWNTLGTFMKFLKREDERERRLRGHGLPQNPDTDASSDSALPHSDDIPFPSSDADSDYSTCSDSVLFPFASSAITPFPAHPAHRKRVQSAERRLERLTQTGLSKSQLSDEEDEEDVRKKKSRKKRAPSVEIPDGKVKEESNSPEDFNPFVDDEVEI